LREVIHENRLTVEELGERLDDFVAQRDRAILRIQQLEDHERELEQELSKTQKDFLNARREVEELTEAIRPLQEMRESKLGTMLALWHEFKKKIGF
jgi:chromosome segregation ATPase